METSTDETTNETTAPLSMPLEGERDSQATSGSTRAHSEGAEPPDGTADAQDGTQTQRCAKGTRTGQQHDASAHGEGRWFSRGIGNPWGSGVVLPQFAVLTGYSWNHVAD
ncbi:hypothetical protein BU15DRAFT_63546 [Melanogaster broomeanus]|nr:hypothetical protein BU15DRAFT_63546 [Melanogaster broomeanus]